MSMASGLTDTAPKYHWDIYAILVALQEVYFGHETQVNVNLIETVTLPDRTERVYLSPTKRRGVERRVLLDVPVHNEDQSQSKPLTDLLDCGIPGTCGKEDCPICRVYGALITEPGKRVTFIGRVTHGGGVAIQPLPPTVKRRAMHPSELRREEGQQSKEPTIFQREYGAPGLLFPVYNHVLAASEEEFQAVAYAFLKSLPRLGAGNPKGLALLEDEKGPYLVLDKYLSPLGKRVVLNPTETDPKRAMETFWKLAHEVYQVNETETNPEKAEAASQQSAREVYEVNGRFKRFIGESARRELQRLADAFVAGLQKYWR
jgi:hypothetical protein